LNFFDFWYSHASKIKNKYNFSFLRKSKMAAEKERKSVEAAFEVLDVPNLVLRYTYQLVISCSSHFLKIQNGRQKRAKFCGARI